MKIGFLTHEPFHPPSGGGSAEAVYLVRELVARGHEVHLFGPVFPDSSRTAREWGITAHLFRGWAMGRYARWRNLKYLAYPWALERMVTRIAARERFDVLVSQHAIAAVTAGRVKRRLGTPIVMNLLDYLTGFMESWSASALPRQMVRRLMDFELGLPTRYDADAVLTVSDPLAELVAKAGYDRDRIRPIYYGYDSALFQLPQTPVPLSDPPVVVMHGSFDRHHLGPIARTAVARIAQERPDTRFRFVGRVTPTLERFCRDVTRSTPAARLECTGFVPYAEIAGRLASAAVGLIPYEESAGTHCAFVAKLVEYMALGVPSVCTPLRSARQYFGSESMVRFSAFEGASVAERISSWLDTPIEDRRRWAGPSALRVREELDWPVIARRASAWVEETVRRTAYEH